ncbi:hypothetical protein TH63_17665 [Rufibacter radiotolerans]|uniref:FAS1 domain-containing protein n=1 Tax=Rufibacter radiotolerans TaxID=1379910 RepID=A0A0H4VP08_9BACT|nr:fasciclin domain-containing protein [Rufibacter radiotolerans]AKQ47053.1 hypothetical protein TH63_17665 [Rufibacter radiotolerans]
MKKNFTYLKICLLLLVCTAVPIGTQAQVTVTGAAATAKMAHMTLAEGITHKQTLLLELVTKAGLMPLLSHSDPYTFFAPSEAALAAYKDASPEDLRAFLGQHLVASSITSEDLKDGTDIKNINGNNLRIYRKKGAILVDGVKLLESDQLYTNGVWHQLNGALQPPRPKL